MSWRLKLGISSKIAIAALRAVVQLSLLGYVLLPIFRLNDPILVTAYASLMIVVATAEAEGRLEYVYPAGRRRLETRRLSPKAAP